MRFLLCALAVSVVGAAPPLKPVKSIPLLNVKGRIDHMSADVRGGRLFVSALGNNTVEVVDVNNGKLIRSIAELKAPQGVLFVPDANRLIVASRDDGTIRFYDGSSFQLLKTINKTTDADNIRYDASTKTIIAGYADGALGFFDVTGKQFGEARLEGHPESFLIDTATHRLFVNVPTSGYVAVINTDSRSTVRTIPNREYSANYAMALDQKNSRLFVVARRPPKLLVFDTSGGRAVDDRRTVGDVDDIFYDAARHRIYIAGGEGSVDVINQADKDHYAPIATIPTAGGARTALFVPEWNRLFVAAPQRGNQPAQILVFDAVD